MRLFKNKKGDTGDEEHKSIYQLLITLVVAGTIIALTAFLLIKPWSLFEDNDMKIAMQNFDRLIEGINNDDAEIYLNFPYSYRLYSYYQDENS